MGGGHHTIPSLRWFTADILHQLAAAGPISHPLGGVQKEQQRQRRALISGGKLHQIKQLIVDMFEESTYGVYLAEESVESYMARMTFNSKTGILCLPVRLIFNH